MKEHLILALAIVLQTKELLKTSEQWTKKVFARTVYDREVKNISPNATCWRIMGAMGKSFVALTNDQTGLYDAALLSDPAVKVAQVALACAIKKTYAEFDTCDFENTAWTDNTIAKFNDDDATTHEMALSELGEAAVILSDKIAEHCPTAKLLSEAVMQQMSEKNAHAQGIITLAEQLRTSQMWLEAKNFVSYRWFDELKDIDSMTVAELREEGYCVIIWTPAEMSSASHSDLEDIVIQRGNEYLGTSKGEEAEGE